MKADKRIRETVYAWPWEKQYDVLTALRGPDVRGYLADRLKNVYTLAFRRIVFKQSHRGWVLSASRVSMLADALCNLDRNNYTLSHFTSHLIEAMDHVYTHRIWRGEGQLLKDALKASRYDYSHKQAVGTLRAIAARLKEKDGGA